MYRKLLMWLISKEMEKDDIRYGVDSIFHRLISKTCDVEWNKYTEDNVYGITYLIMHSFLKAIKFKNKGSKTLTLIDLDSKAVMSGINTEIIAYYAYNGDADYTDEKAYTLAEAKYNLLNK